MSRVDRIAVECQLDEGPPGRGGGGRRRSPAERRARSLRDDWLEAKLKGLYDDVASEPLPDALQQLIDQLDG